MAMGQDMKSLVDDILASRDTRAKALYGIRKDTHQALGEARKMLKDFAKASEERAAEVKKMAYDVKTFLKSSAENRKHDFGVTMKTVQASLEDVRNDSKRARQAGKTIAKDARILLANIAKDNEERAKELHASLKKGEIHRKGEFATMMGEIQEDIRDVQDDIRDVKHDVAKVRKDASDMVSRYHHSRMSAHEHWASLSKLSKSERKHKSGE